MEVDKEEGYYNIAHKSLEIMIQGSKEADYILKLDDDTYVQVERVVNYVRTMPQSVLTGWINADGEPHRKAGPWQISYKDYPYSVYPPFPHGSAYVASRDIGEALLMLQNKADLKVVGLSDSTPHHEYEYEHEPEPDPEPESDLGLEGLEVRRRFDGPLGEATQGRASLTLTLVILTLTVIAYP